MHSVRFANPISSLGGRRFEPQEELSLHRFARFAASTLPGRFEEVLVVPEMPSPLGLPDFVVLAGGQEWLAARQTLGVAPIVSEVDCKVLSTLHSSQPLLPATIAMRIGWSVDETVPVLERLARMGALVTTSRGAHRMHPVLKPQGAILALEAKVKDWQKAVFQGRAYRTWANNYIVLLGEVGPVAIKRARAQVTQDGGGLFIASKWVVRPRVRQPPPAQRLRGFEYLYAAIGSSVPTF